MLWLVAQEPQCCRNLHVLLVGVTAGLANEQRHGWHCVVKLLPDIQCPFGASQGIEDYVHRIGRTGRAGATGVAVTLFTSADSRMARDLARVRLRQARPCCAAYAAVASPADQACQ